MKFFQPRHLPVGRWPACLRAGLDIARRRAGSLLAVGLAAALPAWGVATFVDPAHGSLGEFIGLAGFGSVLAHALFAAVLAVCMADDGIRIEAAAFLRVTGGWTVISFAMFSIVNALYIAGILAVYFLMPSAMSALRDSEPVPDAAVWSLVQILIMMGNPIDVLVLFIAVFARRTVSGLRAIFVVVLQAATLNAVLLTVIMVGGAILQMGSRFLPALMSADSGFFRALAFVPYAYLPAVLYPYVREIMGAGSENRRLTSDFAFGAARRAASGAA